MKRWDAVMPKQRADDGNAHVVVAFKRHTNARMEFAGQITNVDADRLMQMAIEMMKNAKESDNG